MTNGWSFAATSQTVGGLPRAIQGSFEHAMQQRNFSDTSIAQIAAASKVLVDALESGLWGVGPFSVTLSGGTESLYLSVKSEVSKYDAP